MEIDDAFGLSLLISSVFIVIFTVKSYSKLMDRSVRKNKMEKIKQ